MKGQVHYQVKEGIAVLTLDNPPVNPLSSGIRQGLWECTEKALADDAVKGIVLTGAGRAFIAGADISEFGGKMEGAPLHDVLVRLEQSTKPVVAAINGTAFGGGLEVALCTNFRIASPGAMLGLPEVNLGLLPGAGGTQRLPRLLGVREATRFIVSGVPMTAAEALEKGVVDEVAADNLIDRAVAFAQEKAQSGELPKVRDKSDKLDADRAQLDEVMKEGAQLAARTRRGQEAPQRILQCVQAAATENDFDAGLKKEGELFVECLNSPQREAMIHVFFSERTAARVPDVPKETPTKDINRAVVIGSGTMGGGIAMCFANAGIPVTVLDQDEENLKRGLGVVRKNYQSQVDRKRISQGDMDKRMGAIGGALDYDAIGNADIVVEAVYENLDLKKEIFQRIDKIAPAGAILASNTSALDIDQMAEMTSRPGDVIGTHFFSPANVMRLLEVVRGAKSSKETIATAMKLGKRLGKIAVLAGNCPGFIGNRMLAGYSRQASLLLLEGALPAQVDKVLYEFGMPMGPFQMSDLVGLDLGWRARKMAGGSNEPTARIPDALCDEGHFGQKSGQGFYRYEAGNRTPQPVPEVQELVERVSKELGYTRRDISDEEILKRCIYPLINEGARILDEGMAIRSSDIDVVYIYGYGFPAWRGGPMHYANALGLDKVLTDIRGFEGQDARFWKPAAGLQKLASEGGSFA